MGLLEELEASRSWMWISNSEHPYSTPTEFNIHIQLRMASPGLFWIPSCIGFLSLNTQLRLQYFSLDRPCPYCAIFLNQRTLVPVFIFAFRCQRSRKCQTKNSRALQKHTAMDHDENILKHEDCMTGSIAHGGLVSMPKTGLNWISIDNLEVTWDGPDDPENPKNWATRRKWLAVISISGFVLMSPLPTTIVAPALEIITEELDVTTTVLRPMVLSIFLLGYAIGPMFISPLSEIRGRTLVLQAFNFVFLVFNSACGVARTIEQLLAFRFFAGLFGSCTVGVGHRKSHFIYLGMILNFNPKDRSWNSRRLVQCQGTR